MKRRILVRIVLVLILLLALYPLTKFVILPLFDTSGELEGHDVPLYGYSEPDTPMVMENDALRFELDPATTHFTLTDKRTGHVWLSSPDNADSDPIALPVEKNKLNSTLSLTYAASTGMTTQFTSQEHSISNGVYEVLMQEDGSVRVNYSVGRVQRSFLMPTAIGDARMQQFMEKMTSKQKKDIKEYYREYNIDKLRKTDDKAALLAAYPDLAEEHVWVLRDGTKDHLKQRCESIFAEVGYTAEDLAYDNSRIVQAGSTIAKAVFNVDNYKEYLSLQCDAALRNIVRVYPYDVAPNVDTTGDGQADEGSLRGSSEVVAKRIQDEIQKNVTSAGIEIIEARITYLAYAPEIAAVMLQRQQASAIIDARKMIVDGAVGMVEMALDRLSENKVVELDDERKAAMVSNLLVVLCGNRDAQPIVNSGSLY